MIINQHLLVEDAPIKNMLQTKERHLGFSHGLTECGYDIRIAESVWMFPFRRFVLSSALEEFQMPRHLMGRVLNKSTWARLGVDASMTTNIEPGWSGILTLELRYSGWKPLKIPAGVGIAQVIFEDVAVPVEYRGKYQNQEAGPQKARFA
jgi:dCTP deaminase